MSGSASAPTLVLTDETAPFRLLARAARPHASDAASAALDLGASTGVVAHELTRSFARVVALDVSGDMRRRARERFPELDYREMDVLADADALGALFAETSARTVFVDIGGDRMMDTVLLLLARLERDFVPWLVVVKSRQLHAAMGGSAVPARRAGDGERDGGGEGGDDDDARGGAEGEAGFPSAPEAPDAAAARLHELTAAALAREARSRRLLHPLRYPLRVAPTTGGAICRYHNYLACKPFEAEKARLADRQRQRRFSAEGGADCGTEDGADAPVVACRCVWDHEHCHHCLQPGHRALECPALLTGSLVRPRSRAARSATDEAPPRAKAPRPREGDDAGSLESAAEPRLAGSPTHAAGRSPAGTSGRAATPS